MTAVATTPAPAPVAGSVPLENARHEAFALGIVGGMSQREAYRAAGYKPKTDEAADAAASRLLSDVKVAARVAWIKSQAVADNVMGLNEVLAEFSHVGRANMRDFVHLTLSDNLVNELQDLPPEVTAAIQELTVESYTEDGDAVREALEQQPQGGALKRQARPVRVVKRIKLKLHPKLQALSELRAHHEPQRHVHTGKDGGPIAVKDESEPISELELGRRVVFALELGRRALAAAAAATPAAPPPAAAKPTKG